MKKVVVLMALALALAALPACFDQHVDGAGGVNDESKPVVAPVAEK